MVAGRERGEAQDAPDANIAWEGNSKEVISSFPDEVKQNLASSYGGFSPAKSLRIIAPCRPSAKASSN